MTHSIISRKTLVRALAVLFWLAVWQLASAWIGQEILLVSPVSTLKTLFRLMGERGFYVAVAASFARILAGFLLALGAGVILAALSYVSPLVRALLEPMMTAIKATPVASFVILALIWISARDLSIFASFLMVLPILYTNVLAGLRGADEKLLEMARVYRLSPGRRARAILIPAAFPYLLSACKASLGICWKAGIAAEVIGQPSRSIGDALYRSKIFLSTGELFAWTLVIILISVLLEKVMIYLIEWIRRRVEGA